MKNTLLLFILLFCTLCSSGQVITFQNNYGADTAHEEGQTVLQVADSGYFICGQRLLDTGYIGQGMLMRTDKFGNEVWRKHYNLGGSTHIRFDDMTMASDGNLVVTGQVYYNVGDFNAYIAKLDTAGNMIWERSYGGEGRQSGSSVKETLDGGFIVCGYNDSFPSTIPEFYLLRTDSQGDSLWAKAYSNDMEQYSQAIGLTSDSGFVMVGSAQLSSQLGGRPYVVRTDKNGDTLWTRVVAELETGQAVDVHIKANGGIVITGSSNALSWGPKPMLAELDDATGGLLWFELYYNGTLGHFYNLCATTDGGFAVSGKDTTGDFYVVKTNGTGLQEWFRLIDESPSDWGRGIQQTSDGGYIITGTAIYNNYQDPDIMLIKLDENGLLSSKFTKAKEATAISIYPNPGKDLIYIRNSSGEKLLAVELRDLTGKLVRAYDAEKTAIDISGLNKGGYMLKLVTNNGTLDNKLLIE